MDYYLAIKNNKFETFVEKMDAFGKYTVEWNKPDTQFKSCMVSVIWMRQSMNGIIMSE